MNRTEVVTRARSQLGRGVHYALGKGGIKSGTDSVGLVCDCSGFIWWVLGRSRFDGERWWDTRAIHDEALKDKEPRIFEYVAWGEARPGDLLVWGDHNGHHGHIGIVTEMDAEGPSRVIHCSAGNYRALKDAIAETDPGIFKSNGAIVARPTWIGDETE